MSIFVDKNSRVVVQGITGKEGQFHTRQCVAYGTPVVAGVTPGKGGQAMDDIPVFNTVKEAVRETGANCSMIFVPPPFAADAIMEAADGGVDLSFIEKVAREIADGMTAHKIVVDKSTVPVKTGQKVSETIKRYNTRGVDFDVVSKADDSPLTQKALAELSMPANSLVVAYFRGDDLIIPAGADRARAGDEALILGTSEVISEAEQMASTSPEVTGTVVIAGAGGATGRAVAAALSSLEHITVKLFERDRLVYRFLKQRQIPMAYLMAGGYGDHSWEVYTQFLQWALVDQLGLEPTTQGNL